MVETVFARSMRREKLTKQRERTKRLIGANTDVNELADVQRQPKGGI